MNFCELCTFSIFFYVYFCGRKHRIQTNQNISHETLYRQIFLRIGPYFSWLFLQSKLILKVDFTLQYCCSLLLLDMRGMLLNQGKEYGQIYAWIM